MYTTNADGFIVPGVRKLDTTPRNPHTRHFSCFMQAHELQALPVGSMFVFDTECYSNYWLAAFKHLDSGKYITFEQSPAGHFDPDKLLYMLSRFCLVGFNSLSYDWPMIHLALKGVTCGELKQASDYIIQSGKNYGTEKVTSWVFAKNYELKLLKGNHIDLFNLCPVNGGITANPASLKLYAGRLHAPHMQDLPFPPDYQLTQADAQIVLDYCCNDLDNTELLYNELKSEIALRVSMSYQFQVDLRSKSDAQIAESVICKELQKVLNYYPQSIPLDKQSKAPIRYTAPSFIGFQTAELQSILTTLQQTEFELDYQGSPIMPTAYTVQLGEMVYKLGMGGLHSTETCTAHVADEHTIIADNDVESFYPRTVLNQRLCPPHLGESFLTVYEGLVNTRLYAKSLAKSGDKKAQTYADTLKITINGCFGKLGNQYSALYAPQLMLQVTITGQLVLLMLIEALEAVGIQTISANTDGIISKYPVSRHAEVRSIIAAWEAHTGYKTEETRYKAVYSRDVNNYIAIKYQGKPDAAFFDERLGCKTKGAYSERGSALNSILSKNPEALICIDAVLNYLVSGKSLESTIMECDDFRRFVCIRSVNRGAEHNGTYLGKVVRWYYAKSDTPTDFIAIATSGNKVAKTEGAKPAMDMPTAFPLDVDHAWYVRTAVDMLYELGRLRKAQVSQLPLW